jgi:hypothetical protein
MLGLDAVRLSLLRTQQCAVALHEPRCCNDLTPRLSLVDAHGRETNRCGASSLRRAWEGD